jgi:hypothetical protein
MLKDGRTTLLAAATLLLSSLPLGGCANSSAGSSLMDARAEAPALKKSVYLPVEHLPPKRDEPVMTPDERLKLQKELIAARDRQVPDGKARGGTARAHPVKP